MPALNSDRILVLGIGNLLWADEGFGVRAVQTLHSRWSFEPRVTLMDGGTQGFNLLPFVQDADRMIVFDAIDYGLAPGTLKVLTNAQVPRFMGSKKLSLHQTGFQEVLGVAELTGRLPAELMLIGVQPDDLEDFGGRVRPCVRDQIEPALQIALGVLRAWGCAAAVRRDRQAAPQYLLPESLDMTSYESGCSDVAAAPTEAAPPALMRPVAAPAPQDAR